MKREFRVVDTRNITNAIYEKVDMLNSRKYASYIKHIMRLIRHSYEYKEYIKYLKKFRNLNRCALFQNIRMSRSVKIELHHEPFTLFDIVDIVYRNQRRSTDGSLHSLDIARIVTELHYQDKIGLVPLSVTVHELYHSGMLYIDPQWIHGDWAAFLRDYYEDVPERLKEKLAIWLDDTNRTELLEQNKKLLRTKYIHYRQEWNERMVNYNAS